MKLLKVCQNLTCSLRSPVSTLDVMHAQETSIAWPVCCFSGLLLEWLSCMDGRVFCVWDTLQSFKMHSQQIWGPPVTRTCKLRQHWDRFRVSVGILLGEMTSIRLPEHSPGRVNSISSLPPSLQSGSILGALHYYTQGTCVLTWLAVFRTGVFWDKEATDGCISPSGHQTRGSVYLFQAESLLNWIIVIFQLSVRPEITKNLI